MSRGGGIANYGGILTLTGSTVSGNSTQGDGGGVFNHKGGTMILTHSTVSDNGAGYSGGGIANYGTMTITNE